METSNDASGEPRCHWRESGICDRVDCPEGIVCSSPVLFHLHVHRAGKAERGESPWKVAPRDIVVDGFVRALTPRDNSDHHRGYAWRCTLENIIEDVENDQGVSLDAGELLRLARRAVAACDVRAARDPHNLPKLTISAVDDTGTSVTVRLPPSTARHDLQTTIYLQDRFCVAAADIRDGARARAAKADAAFAKMRRGAAALREAVRIYDASFEQTSAAGGQRRTGLAGISPVKTAPPSGGRRWRADALAAADEMEAAARDADAHAAGTAEWTSEANERGGGGGVGAGGGATGRGRVGDFAPGGDERERAAKKAKRGLQLAADVAGD
ncbi:predicted protein [Micromonas commoda]|uniref:Uncharacterized protein n=1 Tax=Micromonas commoda (strain RCC299 / NOUM17 / CCMP2709) TaxID=296587 RepID=C1EIR9_MICCC|nr:predicted protein [Micromonas commoda]ACO67908.1 predicted protein [Micromonas commoda]|eukprot:XP_002506650.1 predicted protein [Micromonas commoda]